MLAFSSLFRPTINEVENCKTVTVRDLWNLELSYHHSTLGSMGSTI